MERLQKVIANSGITSRRKAEKLITSGKVSVNGEVIRELGTKVSSSDLVIVDGIRVNTEAKEYYLVNKPRGVVSTTSDEFHRKTVVELINTEARIYPIGRLDYDTTGLILLTNDGELANILMHPRNEVEKVYIVKINGIITMEQFHAIKKGIEIDKVIVKPTKIKIRNKDIAKKTTMIEINIVEGRNHIIKRIFENFGYEVLKLSRIRYGYLDLGNLQSGEYRQLNPKEVKKLYNYNKKTDYQE